MRYQTALRPDDLDIPVPASLAERNASLDCIATLNYCGAALCLYAPLSIASIAVNRQAAMSLIVRSAIG
jgi:hypothetical protein